MGCLYSTGCDGEVIGAVPWTWEVSIAGQTQTQLSEQTWRGMHVIMMCTCGESMRTELLYTTRSKIAEIRANLDQRRANAAEKTGKRGAAIVIFALLLRSRAMRFVGQKRRVFS
jgi:hypothetical protein